MNDSGVYLLDNEAILDFVDKMTEFYGSEVEVEVDDN